jgi:hypothetical protein
VQPELQVLLRVRRRQDHASRPPSRAS